MSQTKEVYQVCVQPKSKEEEDECDVPDSSPGRIKLLEKLTIIFGEYLGTLVLVFIACMGCTGMQTDLTPLQNSLNSGLAVMAVIHIFGHVSGAHVNPAVSLAALIMDRITPVELAIYVGSQLAGALTGYGLLMLATPILFFNTRNNPYGQCVTVPHDHLSGMQAMFIELVLTAILVLAICSTWDRKNHNKLDSVALRIGLVVVMLGLAGGSYTGASMNPARSFGPAALQRDYSQHLVYWVGPTLGSLFAAYTYKKLLLREKW